MSYARDMLVPYGNAALVPAHAEPFEFPTDRDAARYAWEIQSRRDLRDYTGADLWREMVANLCVVRQTRSETMVVDAPVAMIARRKDVTNEDEYLGWIRSMLESRKSIMPGVILATGPATELTQEDVLRRQSVWEAA